MPLPGDIVTIILTGTYLDMQGNARTGTVTLAPSTPILVDAESNTILGAIPVVEALVSGAFSVTLPCTSGLTPAGWVWQVTENVSGAPARSYAVALPSTLGSTVDISTLTPVTVPSETTTYILGSALGEPDGPAQLNSGGLVPIAQGGTDAGSAQAALVNLGAAYQQRVFAV